MSSFNEVVQLIQKNAHYGVVCSKEHNRIYQQFTMGVNSKHLKNFILEYVLKNLFQPFYEVFVILTIQKKINQTFIRLTPKCFSGLALIWNAKSLVFESLWCIRTQAVVELDQNPINSFQFPTHRLDQQQLPSILYHTRLKPSALDSGISLSSVDRQLGN